MRWCAQHGDWHATGSCRCGSALVAARQGLVEMPDLTLTAAFVAMKPPVDAPHVLVCAGGCDGQVYVGGVV